MIGFQSEVALTVPTRCMVQVVQVGSSRWNIPGSDSARMIITRDKTQVQGDILVDDKPRVSGSRTPSWKHVLFSQSYNQGMEGKGRLSVWTEWADTLSKSF